jgi:two-component system sensor histidine kinase/response regulator
VVSIRTEPESHDLQRLRFQVRDTGIGMSEAELALLFQAFSQADASISRKYGGTGLGLSICKRLVELMGGEIVVRSHAGQGSTFEFTVLVGRDRRPRRAASALQMRSGRRTLVVDDNVSALLVAKDMLTALHFDVDTAEDGLAALDALARSQASGKPYDLVMLDWKMPGMDGLQVAGHLLSGARPDAPVVIMATAHAEESLRTQAAALGVKGVISKPYSASMLYDTIVSAMDGPVYVADVPHEASETEAALHLNGARVLVAEDNEINQQIATELLERVGVSVTIANNGQEAIDLASPEFDAILMDLQMPVMDGLEATRRLMLRKDLAAVPIIAMTANAMVEDRRRVAVAGMCYFVAKPIDPGQLYATLVKWLRPRPVTGSARPFAPPMASQPSPPLQLPGLPLELPGIAVALVLGRLGGNGKLLADLLKRFRHGHWDAAARIRDATESGDLEAGRREAHMLHGLAANLGAIDVAAYAAEVESALQEGRSHTSALHRLADAIEVVMAGLGRVEPDAPRPVSDETHAASPPTAAVHADLAQVRKLLANDDVGAGVAIETLLAGTPLPPHLVAGLTEVAQFAGRYAFDEGLSHFDLLMAREAP